ncbi:MAG: hypothetical protein NUV42_01565 [Candidatus Yonathbacteria bacterium]|nr:hypothetical protein [Candidatus Yonathbacteria bacterium]
MNDKADGSMEIQEGAFCPIDTSPLIGRREQSGRPCTDLHTFNDPEEITQQEDTQD